MANLVETSPYYETIIPEERQSFYERLSAFLNMFKCNKGFYFLPHGNGLKAWTTLRVIAAMFSTAFTAAQITFAFPPTVGFGVTLAFDFVVWADM